MNKQFLLALILLFGGYASSIEAQPVIDKSPFRVIPEVHRVQAGESIYTISWQYGVDYKQIAKLNGLSEPYRLNQNQAIKIKQDAANGSASASPISEVKIGQKPTPTPKPSTVKPKPEKPSSTSSSSVASTAQAGTNVGVVGAVGAAQAVSSANNAGGANAANANTGPGAVSGNNQWFWPAQGKLTAKFSVAKGINGIQISGSNGRSINAAASGEVVYAGSGLRGYGNLVILKHADDFLSAYAHNEEIFVAEGDKVAAQQRIASMGNSGTQSTMLHFEIRRRGKPTDPLQYLPKKT